MMRATRPVAVPYVLAGLSVQGCPALAFPDALQKQPICKPQISLRLVMLVMCCFPRAATAATDLTGRPTINCQGLPERQALWDIPPAPWSLHLC